MRLNVISSRRLVSLLQSFFCVMLLAQGAGAHAETITIGAEDAWYPYSGVVNGQARGYTVDLVRAAFAAVNVDVKFESVPYARCMRMVKEGRLLACFDTARAAMVENDYLWHKKPMFNSRAMIYALTRNGGKNLGVPDIEGKKVIVTHNYEYGDAFDSNKKVIRFVAPNDLAGFRMLAAGRGQYALAYERVGDLLIKEHPAEFGKIVPVGHVGELELYTVFSKTFKEGARYLELFDRGLETITRNGRVREIEAQWK